MSILNFLKKINAKVQEEINREWAKRHDLSRDMNETPNYLLPSPKFGVGTWDKDPDVG